MSDTAWITLGPDGALGVLDALDVAVRLDVDTLTERTGRMDRVRRGVLTNRDRTADHPCDWCGGWDCPDPEACD
jgi:hypothetical protein